MNNQLLLRAAIAVLTVSATAVPARASQIFISTGQSVTFGGSTFAFGSGAVPWTAEIYATAGQCLRLFVPSQGTTDLKTTVVAPNGAVFRDDDGGGSNRPLVKINGTPNTGWYTVTINQYNGLAVTGDFSLNIQRLNLNSAGCVPGTAPALASASAVAKQ
jgi:hypothetical protein